MNIIEAMKERRSMRSFDGKGLTKEQREQLLATADAATSPFGGSVSIRLQTFDLKGDFKPSTYGVIRGATDYFLLGIAEGQDSELSAGFKFEQVVLKAWQMGLGACWIAATFKGTDFERGQSWPDGQELKIICPVGVGAKAGFLEKMTRLAVGSKNRKPFEQLFFSEDFKTPYDPSGRFGEALDMMRLAPSSTNSQPWRAVVCGDTVHFYAVPKSKCSVLDCGIGICHFAETEKYNNHSGTFHRLPTAPQSPDNWTYLTSYTPTN